MNRTLSLLACALLLLLVSPAPAHADYKVPVSNQHVAVLQDGTCFSNLFGVVAFSTSDVNVFLFARGQQASVCTFADIGVYPESAQVLHDFSCSTSFGVATNTSATLTPTGRLTFTCFYVP